MSYRRAAPLASGGWVFFWFGKGRECFTHHNAKPPFVGLPTGLASGPEAVWTGSPVLYLLNTPYAGDPATSRYVKSTVGPLMGSNSVNRSSAQSLECLLPIRFTAICHETRCVPALLYQIGYQLF